LSRLFLYIGLIAPAAPASPAPGMAYSLLTAEELPEFHTMHERAQGVAAGKRGAVEYGYGPGPVVEGHRR